MKCHAAAAAAIAGVPVLGVLRPAWVAQPGDMWRMAADMAEAAALLSEAPRRVLLTIGQKDLAAFRAAPWHSYVVRSVDAPDPASLPPRARVIAARGPFYEAGERALLTAERIDTLVTKNSGGLATVAKLHAARGLGIGVVMIDRPPPPDLPCVPGRRAGEWRGSRVMRPRRAECRARADPRGAQ